MHRLPARLAACALAVAAIACGKGGRDGDRPGSAAPVVAPTPQVNYEDAPVKTALHRLGEQAYAYQGSHVEFRAGSVGLTPAVTCGSTGEGQCNQSDADWADPIWVKLDYQEVASATHVRYSYQGDRLHFTATATADID